MTSYINKVKEFDMIEDFATASKEELIKSHLRLVTSIAIKFRGYNHPKLDDYIQEGNLALIKCAENFDPSMGVKFASYCMTFIQKAIVNYDIDTKYPIKTLTTKPLRKAFFNLKKYTSQDKVDVEKMSKELNISKQDIYEVMQRKSATFFSTSTIRLNLESLGPDPLIDIRDETYSPETVMRNLEYEDFLENQIHECISVLNDRERFIIENRYFTDSPMVFADIAPIFGVSIERIRQIEVAALKKMKKVLTPAYEACKIETA